MIYIQLTTSERVKIETYFLSGFSIQKIAGRLGRKSSMGSRKLRWGAMKDKNFSNTPEDK